MDPVDGEALAGMGEEENEEEVDDDDDDEREGVVVRNSGEEEPVCFSSTTRHGILPNIHPFVRLTLRINNQ